MKNLIVLFALIFNLIYINFCVCQQTQFAKIYFTSGDHSAAGFIELNDSSFFLAGYTSNLMTTNDNYSFVMRINKYGDTLFTRKYISGEIYGLQYVSDSIALTGSGFYTLYNYGINTMRTNVNNGDTLEYRQYGYYN